MSVRLRIGQAILRLRARIRATPMPDKKAAAAAAGVGRMTNEIYSSFSIRSNGRLIRFQ